MYTGSPIYQHRSYLQSSHFFYNLIEEHEKNYPHYHTKNYRYAFNGMEQDKEVSGNGNSYTTQFRQYDPRLGRWKSIDPLAHKFASINPYAGMGNNPMFFIDPLGLEPGGPGDKSNPHEFGSEGEATEFLEGRKDAAKNGESQYYNVDGVEHMAKMKITDKGKTRTWVIYERHSDPNNNTFVPKGSSEKKPDEKSDPPPPPKKPQKKPFAIYVAFPDATARIGSNDKSDIAKEGGKILGGKPLPVGHTGVIIGSNTGETHYFDFGRFGADKSKGIVRSSESSSRLNTIGGTFGDDGYLNNTSSIVKNLVYGNNSYFKSHLNQYSNVMFAYYPDLNFDAMYRFATSHGSKNFGFADGSSFCTKFANDVIRAGGGELDVINDRINENKAQLIKDIFFNSRNLKKVTEKRYVPTPNNYVKDIQDKFPEQNVNIKLE
jgi:RHS repeat-associated protein